MTFRNEYPHLVKFLVMSALSFFVGAFHGMLQVLPPIRAWLDAIGSPYGGPGHMIDPLAHAHINLVGGVVLLAMGTTYYLLPIFSGRSIYSIRLINYSLWWTAIGQFYFYITQVVFGIWEGNLLLEDPSKIESAHHYYGPIVAGAGITMAMGFFFFLLNVLLSLRMGEKLPTSH
jgi:cytochrome c oxidase cbb3-type subunit 1